MDSAGYFSTVSSMSRVTFVEATLPYNLTTECFLFLHLAAAFCTHRLTCGFLQGWFQNDTNWFTLASGQKSPILITLDLKGLFLLTKSQCSKMLLLNDGSP